MRAFRWSSLSFQLIGVMLGLTLGLGLIRTYLNRAELESFAREQFSRRSIATASAFAAYATDAVLTDDRFRLNELIGDTRLNNPDVRYILVFDAQQRVVAHSFGQGIPRGLLELNSVQANERATLQRVNTEEGMVLDVAVPLVNGSGAVRVGMSERALQADLDRHTFNLLLVTLLSLVPIFIAAFLLARVLARPLEKLVGVTQAVAQGDFSRAAPVTGQAEIAQLGKAFNAMTRALAQSQNELRASNAQLRERNDELAALNAFTTALSVSADRDDLLARALAQMLAIMNVPGGWIVLGDDPNATLAAARNVEVNPEWLRAECMRPHSTAAELAHDGAPCPLLGSCHLVVPLGAHERLCGALYLLCPNAPSFTAEQLRLLTAMGQQIGVALENLELANAQRRAQFRRQLLMRVIDAQEEERKRIARELHDEFAQSLTALIVGLQTLEQTAAATDGTRTRLVETRGLAARILTQTRRLIFDLRPSVLDDAGLVPALQSFAERVCDPHPIAVAFEIRGTPRRLPAPVETALFRIVQEATHNVVKHAHATQLQIRLDLAPARICATVRDNGCGFDAAAELRAGAIGLLGMRERAELVGGQLTIESSGGRGTCVQVEIPMTESLPE
jgi:signal transduction histidine kinase